MWFIYIDDKDLYKDLHKMVYITASFIIEGNWKVLKYQIIVTLLNYRIYPHNRILCSN